MFLKLHTADGERIFNMDLVIEIMPLEKGCRLNYGFIFHAYASTDVEERYDEIWESILVGGYL